MENWDDLRIFLALAEGGTIRGAAQHLGVTHVTVTRRIRALEARIGATLFERSPSGHQLTEAGRAVLPKALEAQGSIRDLERQVLSIDARLSGPVTLALPEAVATVLIAPLLPELRMLYPQIALRLLLSDRLVNLAGRESDLALRLTASPPETAFGRRIAHSPLCVYAAPAYLQSRPDPDHWIGLDYGPARALEGTADTHIQANGILAMAELLKAGLGVGVLPCFLGDSHTGLQRLPGAVINPDLDLWLLVHKDLRQMARVRAVADFIAERLKPLRPLIEGASAKS